jgi:hypothetical protein
MCISLYYLCFHFVLKNNMDQWYQSKLLLIIFQCMSSMRSEYSRLGVELISFEDNISCTSKKPSMVEEKKNDRGINLLLEKSLT